MATASVDDSSTRLEEPAGDDVMIADADADEITVEPAFTESAEGNLEFTMPPLTLSDDSDAADADVPDDVADAVRRAIAAIESASVAQLPEIADVDLHEAIDVGDAEPVVDPVVDPVVADAPTPAFGGFAPPTMETRAEVLYGQMSAEASIAGADAATLADSPAGGVASVVFVDEPIEGDGEGGGRNDRSSALRRLIGSLRRKDH